jgi:hypothetical protein
MGFLTRGFAAAFSAGGGDFFAAIKVRGEGRKKLRCFAERTEKALGCGLVAEIEFMNSGSFGESAERRHTFRLEFGRTGK